MSTPTGCPQPGSLPAPTPMVVFQLWWVLQQDRKSVCQKIHFDRLSACPVFKTQVVRAQPIVGRCQPGQLALSERSPASAVTVGADQGVAPTSVRVAVRNSKLVSLLNDPC